MKLNNIKVSNKQAEKSDNELIDFRDDKYFLVSRRVKDQTSALSPRTW